jgi:hypothetical protein
MEMRSSASPVAAGTGVAAVLNLKVRACCVLVVHEQK